MDVDMSEFVALTLLCNRENDSKSATPTSPMQQREGGEGQTTPMQPVHDNGSDNNDHSNNNCTPPHLPVKSNPSHLTHERHLFPRVRSWGRITPLLADCIRLDSALEEWEPQSRR